MNNQSKGTAVDRRRRENEYTHQNRNKKMYIMRSDTTEELGEQKDRINEEVLIIATDSSEEYELTGRGIQKWLS